MKKGLSLHIGLNSIDPSHYGTPGTLKACENDARSMKRIADKLGYKSTMLLTANATYDAVRLALLTASNELEAGDTLLLTYSGHGANVRDLNGDEDDYYDETWVLYDRMMVDDDLNYIFSQFKEGVSIVVFSDSCHSGTVTKALIFESSETTEYYDAQARFKFLDPEIVDQTLNSHIIMYKAMQLSVPADIKEQVCASVLLLSACQDNQLASDGTANGKFTELLLTVYNNGAFKGKYYDFYKQICKTAPPSQTPNYFLSGGNGTDIESVQVFEWNSKSLSITDGPVNSDILECVIRVDRNQLSKYSNGGVVDFFTENAGPLFAKCYQQFLDFPAVSFPKGGDVTAGCSASDHGWSCDVHGSIHF